MIIKTMIKRPNVCSLIRYIFLLYGRNAKESAKKSAPSSRLLSPSSSVEITGDSSAALVMRI